MPTDYLKEVEYVESGREKAAGAEVALTLGFGSTGAMNDVPTVKLSVVAASAATFGPTPQGQQTHGG